MDRLSIMALKDKVKARIASRIYDKNKKKSEYDNLDQISMQGQRGKDLLKEIHRLEGEIKAYEWMHESMNNTRP